MKAMRMMIFVLLCGSTFLFAQRPMPVVRRPVQTTQPAPAPVTQTPGMQRPAPGMNGSMPGMVNPAPGVAQPVNPGVAPTAAPSPLQPVVLCNMTAGAMTAQGPTVLTTSTLPSACSVPSLTTSAPQLNGQPGTAQPAAQQPGTGEPGTSEPQVTQPSGNEPTAQPPSDQPNSESPPQPPN